jgi:D-xylose transport system substrate-binding protein
MKKAVLAFFVFAVALSVVFAAGSSKAAKTKDIKDIKVGVSFGHLQEERWQREEEMFKQYAAQHGFKLLVQSAENNVQKQISQCENLINQGIDVLILQTLDASAVTPSSIWPTKRAFKVIAYDRFGMNCDLDYYVTFDSFKVGVTQAKFVLNKVKKRNIIWLKGGPEDNNAHLVAAGQKVFFSLTSTEVTLKLCVEQWCKGWDPNEALKHTENALTISHNNIQGVIASNDGTAGWGNPGPSSPRPQCSYFGQDADLLHAKE